MTVTPVGDIAKQSFDQAYGELIESERFQTQMDALEIPEPPAWLEYVARFLQWLGELLGPLFSWIPSAGGIAKPLIILAIIMLGSMLVFALSRALYRYFADRKRKEKELEQEVDWWPTTEEAQSLLGDADALARAGHYAEAAHILLFRSIEELDQRLPEFLRPALTSRDISHDQALPPAARTAFRAIALIVERGIFAARPVDENGWIEARSAYETFAFGRNWQ